MRKVYSDNRWQPWRWELAEVIRAELADAGYRSVQEETFLDEQSFLIFTPSP